MSQSVIWHALEREVRADGSRVAFEQARGRHAALAPYPTLLDAIEVAASRRGSDEREAIVGAFVAEYQASHARGWSAAALLAMAPALKSLVRTLEKRGERNDANSIVLVAFLDAVSQLRTSRRVAFRLFSETRRRVLHPRSPSVEAHWLASGEDVDRLVGPRAAAMESAIDEVRFARRAGALSPAPGERPDAYLERVQPSSSRTERVARHACLKNQRVDSLADLRDALRAVAV